MSSTLQPKLLSVCISPSYPVFNFRYRFPSLAADPTEPLATLSQIMRIHPEMRSSHISVTTYLTRDPKTVSILHISAYNSSFGNIREYFQAKLSRHWHSMTTLHANGSYSRQTGSLSYFIAITERTLLPFPKAKISTLTSDGQNER